MTDDDLHPLHELASAYLDGDVTPAERAQVEASPELQSLVAQFRDVRAQLADVPPASSSVRDAAFAAAFAQFDAPADTPTRRTDARPAAPVVSLDSRRRWPARIMSAAAVVLLVGAIGVAINRMNTGDDQDSSSGPQTESAKDTMRASADSTATAGAGAPNTIGSIDGAGTVAVQIDSPEALLALAYPGGDSVTGDTAASAETFTGSQTGGATDDSTVADEAATTVAVATLPPATFGERQALSCIADTEVFVADILYQGVLAVAVRDTVSGVVQAYSDSSCDPLVTVSP